MPPIQINLSEQIDNNQSNSNQIDLKEITEILQILYNKIDLRDKNLRDYFTEAEIKNVSIFVKNIVNVGALLTTKLDNSNKHLSTSKSNSFCDNKYNPKVTMAKQNLPVQEIILKNNMEFGYLYNNNFDNFTNIENYKDIQFYFMKSKNKIVKIFSLYGFLYASDGHIYNLSRDRKKILKTHKNDLHLKYTTKYKEKKYKA